MFKSSFTTFYRVFQLTIQRELKILRKEGGGVQVFKALWGRDGVWRSSYLFLNKPINTCNFPEEGGGVRNF